VRRGPHVGLPSGWPCWARTSARTRPLLWWLGPDPGGQGGVDHARPQDVDSDTGSGQLRRPGFDTAAEPDRADGGYRGTRTFLEPILSEAGLPAELADALDDTSFDAELRRETDEALALTGKDVGTPIIHFQPPGGVAFFGPVISRLPSEAEAVPLWDNVLGLASFPGFAELKRSLRERPQLRGFGVEPGRVGVQEDWYAGRRDAPR